MSKRRSSRNIRQRLIRLLAAYLCTVLLPLTAAAESVNQAAVTIIIDDLGYNLDYGMRAVALPGPVTFAVLPFSPHSKELAEAAHREGKEIMLHMPMDNDNHKPLGPGGLTEQLSRSAFTNRLEQAIRSIPHISGVNNHMGSKLTQNPLKMNWVMNSLKQHTLYFVDSRTSAGSVAGSTAQRQHIPNLDRDVFLDHDPRPAAIDAQFRRLIKIAKRTGSAVAIGHPYPSTLGYLENVIPKLDAMGIRLVSPSGLLILKRTIAMQNAAPTTTHHLAANSAPAKTPGYCTITEELDRRLVHCG